MRRQRPSGKFRRRFILPEDVSGDEIKPTYNRGVLELSIPKAAPGGPIAGSGPPRLEPARTLPFMLARASPAG